MKVIPDPTDIVGMSFWLIMNAMLALAVFLFLQRRRLAPGWQTPILVMGSVALISAATYFGLTQLWAESGAVSSAYRFVDWQLTVPLQTVLFYLILRVGAPVGAAIFWRLLIASSVLSAAAYLGAAGFVSPTLGFLVSLAGGLYIIGELYLGETSRVNAANPDRAAQSSYNAIRLIATIGWAIYPLGYFMEYLGGGVDNASINLIYNLADFLNKVTFGLVVFSEAARGDAGRRGIQG